MSGDQNNDIKNNIKELKDSIDTLTRRMDKIETHQEYMKEKFADIYSTIEKESNLLWRELVNQKDEMEENFQSKIRELKEKQESDCSSARIILKSEIIHLLQKVQIKLLFAVIGTIISILTSIILNIIFRKL